MSCQEIIFTRPRLVPTRITYTYLISHLMPLSCPHCDSDHPLTVDHIFECTNLTSLRNSYKIPHNRHTALADNSSSLPYLFPHLRSIGFFYHIQPLPIPSIKLIALTLGSSEARFINIKKEKFKVTNFLLDYP